MAHCRRRRVTGVAVAAYDAAVERRVWGVAWRRRFRVMADLVTFAVLLVNYCAKLVGEYLQPGPCGEPMTGRDWLRNMIEQSNPSLFTFAMFM